MLTPRLVPWSLLAIAAAAILTAPALALDPTVELTEFRVDEEAWCDIRNEWMEDILATHPEGTWATMKFEPTDDQLRRMGFPSREFLLTHRFEEPTLVMQDGTTEIVDLPDVDAVTAAGTTSYAGAGCFGIRPGALLLTVTSNSIGWCTMAHAYGSPGNYQISTAGHCGSTGDIATVIAGTGNRAGATGVVLLDFGKYSKSTGDGGVGRDWALISVNAPWQRLVSPTMCMWGGPIGMYTKTGDTVAVNFPRNGLVPTASANPDPLLVQTIVHYGHGTGVGFPTGTGRAAEVIAWRASHFMFTGAISPGDSGSGSNTAGGDAVGAQREAAGINTHLYVDPLMRSGIGIMAGTRATLVSASLANGQLVPYPAPVPGAP